MIGWFSASLVLGSGPVLDLSAPHSSHVSDVEVGLWPVLSPGWNDTHGTGAAWPCCPLGAPLVQQSPTSLFIYNFTGSNTVLKSEWKKILKIFLYGKIFSKFAKILLKNISGWILHLFPLSSLVCNGLGRNCLFLHLFPELQFLLSPSYCKRKASVLSECL